MKQSLWEMHFRNKEYLYQRLTFSGEAGDWGLLRDWSLCFSVFTLTVLIPEPSLCVPSPWPSISTWLLTDMRENQGSEAVLILCLSLKWPCKVVLTSQNKYAICRCYLYCTLGIVNFMRLSAYCSFSKGMVFEDGVIMLVAIVIQFFFLISLAFFYCTQKESVVIASTFSGLLSNYWRFKQIKCMCLHRLSAPEISGLYAYGFIDWNITWE